MKNAVRLSIFLFLTTFCIAQNTATQSGILTDSDSQIWAKATWTAVPVITGGGGQAHYLSGGAVPHQFTGSLDSTGLFSGSVGRTSQMVPTGTTLKYTICSLTSAKCMVITGVTVTGTTFDAGTFFSSRVNPPRIEAMNLTYAYNTTEILNQVQGNGYVNTITNEQFLWDGTQWVDVGGAAIQPCGTNAQFQTKGGDSSAPCGGQFAALSGDANGLALGSNYTKNAGVNVNTYNSTSTNASRGFSYFGNQDTCGQSNTINGGNWQITCKYSAVNFFGLGYISGDQGIGQQNTSDTQRVIFDYTEGTSQLDYSEFHANKTGDSASHYSYHYNKGGWIDGGGEGHCVFCSGGGNASNVYAGMTAQTGTGLTSLTISNNGDNQPLVGGYLENIDPSVLIASGQITHCDHPTQAPNELPSQCTTTDTHAVSAAISTGNTAIVITTPNVPTGYSTAVTVTGIHGTNSAGFAMGSMIAFACGNIPEYVFPTAISTISGGSQVITANFNYPHTADSCPAYQGGTQGLLDLVADRVGTSGLLDFNGWYRSAYEIFGAEDATHISYTSYQTGGRGDPIFDMIHNFGSTATALSITRTSNFVVACDFSAGPQTWGAQYIQIAGASDASFDGVFHSSNYFSAGDCVGWPQTGADAVIQFQPVASGGAIGGTNSDGQYEIHPFAKIEQALPTVSVVNGVNYLSYSGTLLLWPNNMPVAPSQQLINPANSANKTFATQDTTQYTSAPTSAGQTQHNYLMFGTGVQNNFVGDTTLNENGYDMYQGGGANAGKLFGATARFIGGPWRISDSIEQPLSGGTSRQVVTNAPTNAGATSMFYFDNIHQAVEGIPLDEWAINPSTHTIDYRYNFGASPNATVIGWSLSPTGGFVAVGTWSVKNAAFLSGTTASVGGSSVLPGNCIDGNLALPAGYTTLTGVPVSVAASDGSLRLPGLTIEAEVASGTVIVRICNASAAPITPPAVTYNILIPR